MKEEEGGECRRRREGSEGGGGRGVKEEGLEKLGEWVYIYGTEYFMLSGEFPYWHLPGLEPAMLGDPNSPPGHSA